MSYDTVVLLKSLNTPADLLSQLRQSISLILRLHSCSTISSPESRVFILVALARVIKTRDSGLLMVLLVLF